VKLRIKSFSVPELLIEIPESSTVGSLKVSIIGYDNLTDAFSLSFWVDYIGIRVVKTLQPYWHVSISMFMYAFIHAPCYPIL
jgi:hypothetical protein